MQQWDYRAFIKRVAKPNGFIQVRQTGDHIIWKDNLGRSMSLPNQCLNPCIANRYIKQLNLKVV